MASTCPNMPHVRAWCERHPPMLAAMSLSLATTARHAADLLRVNEMTDHGAVLPMHRDLDAWLPLYRRHRNIRADFSAFMKQDASAAAMTATLEKLMEAVQSLPDDLHDIRHPAAEACGRSLIDAFCDLLSTRTSPSSGTSLDCGQKSFLALWFTLTVQLPCTLLFQTQPAFLFRRARHGDFNAIGQLFLLDRNVVFDPRVARAIHANPKGWNMIREKFPARPQRIRPSRWKVMAGATIRLWAQEVRYQLTHHEIADLFHVLARDSDGVTNDPDISALQGRSFERQVATTVQQKTFLLGLPIKGKLTGSDAVNEQVSRERNCSSMTRS